MDKIRAVIRATGTLTSNIDNSEQISANLNSETPQITGTINNSGSLNTQLSGTSHLRGTIGGSGPVGNYYTKQQIDTFREQDRDYVNAQDLILQTNINKSGHKIFASISGENLTISLLDKNNNVISITSVEIDDRDTYIASGEYNPLTESITFRYNNGISFDVSVSSLVSGLEALIEVEENRAKEAENILSERISSIEEDYLTSSDKNDLESQISNVSNDLSDEVTNRENADTVLSDRISEIENAGYITKDISTTNTLIQYSKSTSNKAISTNINWVEVSTPTLEQQRVCCYGDGYYISCGLNGSLVYSINGSAWLLVNKFTNYNFIGCCYGNGEFLLITNNGELYKRGSSINQWNLIKTFNSQLIKLRYINNLFIITASNGTIYYSYNTEDWKISTIGIQSNINDITYGKNKYMIVGSNGLICSSKDLKTWTYESIAGYTKDIIAIYYFNNMFIIGGKDIKYSYNGQYWYDATIPEIITGNIEDFCYGEGRLYCVLYESDYSGDIWISKDGINFESEYITGGQLWSIYYSDDRYISVGDNGTIYLLNLNISWSLIKPILDLGEYLWQRNVIILTNGDELYSEAYLSTPTKISSFDNDIGYVTKNTNELENYYNIPTADDLLDEKEDIMDNIDNSQIDELFD